MKVVNGGNFSYPRGVSYPIVVSEDTEYRNANFCQKVPHTSIFSVSPGVTVRFVECNLINVTVPDGAEIVGGNLAHLVPAKVGTSVSLKGETYDVYHNLIHECAKCATAQQELADAIKAKTLAKDAAGRIVHHEMKVRFRARRLTAKATTDLSKIQTSNTSVVSKGA